MFTTQYSSDAPTRAEVDTSTGLLVLEFGTGWCGHCQAAQPLLREWIQGLGDVRHLKIEDGPGRPLGRSFKVKLWPTLVLLRDGEQVFRAVRPNRPGELDQALRHTS